MEVARDDSRSHVVGVDDALANAFFLEEDLHEFVRGLDLLRRELLLEALLALDEVLLDAAERQFARAEVADEAPARLRLATAEELPLLLSVPELDALRHSDREPAELPALLHLTCELRRHVLVVPLVDDIPLRLELISAPLQTVEDRVRQ